jgi:cytochrome c oxidase subunit IV
MSHETTNPAVAHGHAAHGGHPHVNYFAIFIALCVCTGISILLDVFEVPSLRWVIVFLVLSVAVAKALFVLTYFMHLKFEGNWKFIILMPTTILAIGLMVALMPDIGLHYYTPNVPQAIQPAAPAPTHAPEAGPKHGH